MCTFSLGRMEWGIVISSLSHVGSARRDITIEIYVIISIINTFSLTFI